MAGKERERRTAFDPGSVLVDRDRILAVGTVAELDADPRAGGTSVPGSCGAPPGVALALDWQKTHVDPAHRALTPEIAAVASRPCYGESVPAGTTSVMDMWRFMEGAAAAAEAIGLRATLVPYVADAEGYDYFETLETHRRLLETHRRHLETHRRAAGRVRAWVGLDLYHCPPAAFRAAIDLAEEFDTGIHTHSSETIWEVQESLARFGARPIEEMFRPGILGPRTRHCPLSLARRSRDRAAGGDGHRGGPLPLFQHEGLLRPGPCRRPRRRDHRPRQRRREGEQQPRPDRGDEVASLLPKVSTLDPITGDPWDVGHGDHRRRPALGLSDETGSLERGKRADIVAVWLGGRRATPPISSSRRRGATSVTWGSTAGAWSLMAGRSPSTPTLFAPKPRRRPSSRRAGLVFPW